MPITVESCTQFDPTYFLIFHNFSFSRANIAINLTFFIMFFTTLEFDCIDFYKI